MHGRVRGEVQLVPVISCWTPHAALVKGKIHLKLVCLDTTRQALDGQVYVMLPTSEFSSKNGFKGSQISPALGGSAIYWHMG